MYKCECISGLQKRYLPTFCPGDLAGFSDRETDRSAVIVKCCVPPDVCVCVWERERERGIPAVGMWVAEHPWLGCWHVCFLQELSMCGHWDKTQCLYVWDHLCVCVRVCFSFHTISMSAAALTRELVMHTHLFCASHKSWIELENFMHTRKHTSLLKGLCDDLAQ